MATATSFQNTGGDSGGTTRTGVVKWFDVNKGFGFIQPDEGSRFDEDGEDDGKDVFVHITAVERSGIDCLTAGQHVSYELSPVDRRKKKPSAINIKTIGKK